MKPGRWKSLRQQIHHSIRLKANSLRVLMVTPRFFPFMGGVENHVYEVARRLARQNVDITVLTTDTSGQLPTDELADGHQDSTCPGLAGPTRLLLCA